ncbi:MAG: SgcJ/EcaC family oxidoreductase [Acidobacteria bacterium]|nr:SgcJ/EcaC family oxidoreductase [Acidobacteriota bacterium]
MIDSGHPDRLTRLRLAAALALALIAAQASALAGPDGSTDAAARAQIEAELQRYAAAERVVDANAIAAFYAPDGELINPGMEIVKGPEAIRKFLASFEGVKIESATMTADSTEVLGDVAMQWGAYAQRVALAGKPAADYHGRFVAQWVRRPGGGWALRRLLTQPAP